MPKGRRNTPKRTTGRIHRAGSNNQQRLEFCNVSAGNAGGNEIPTSPSPHAGSAPMSNVSSDKPWSTLDLQNLREGLRAGMPI